MALASGIAAQIGAGKESTFGTAVTINRFAEFNNESITAEREALTSAGLRAGRRAVNVRRSRNVLIGAGGDVELEVATTGMAWLFDLMFGTAQVTTPGGGTLARDIAFTCADALPSYTVQIGRPDVTGVVRAYTYPGTVCTEWEMSCETGGILTVKPGLNARTEDRLTALATFAPEDDDEILEYLDGTVTLDGTPVDVTKVTIKANAGLKTDRRFIGSPLKKKPIPAALLDLSVELEFEHDGTNGVAALIDSGEVVAFRVVFESPVLIEGALHYSVTVDIPAVQLRGSTPNVEGEDVLMQTVELVALDNETDPLITLTYRSTATAV